MSAQLTELKMSINSYNLVGVNYLVQPGTVQGKQEVGEFFLTFLIITHFR
jgi:hypothetical protein